MENVNEYTGRELTLGGWAANRARNHEAGGLSCLGALLGGNQNAHRGGPKARQARAIAAQKAAGREWCKALACLLRACNEYRAPRWNLED